MHLQHGRRGLAQAADAKRGSPAENEAGHDFIQVEPAKLLPHQHGDRTGDDARQRAVARDAAVKEREDDDRAKGRAKARPRVADHAEHARLGVAGNRDGNERNGQNHGAAKPHQLFLAGLLAQEGAVDIFRERAGAHEQLAGERAHHRRQNGRQQRAGHPGVEELFGQFHEDGFGIGVDSARARRVDSKVGNAHKAYGDRAAQAQHHPGHADAAGVGDVPHRGGSHEAHENVRLAKVAQPPGSQREDADGGLPLEKVELVGVNEAVPVLPGLQLALHGQIGDDGRQQQRRNHHGRLDGVRPADGQKAAYKDVPLHATILA